MSQNSFQHLEANILAQATVYGPHKIYSLDLTKRMFPLSRAPIVSHAIVQKLSRKKVEALLAYLAVLYFHFTDCLEYDEVVPISAMLGQTPHLFGCPTAAGRCGRLIATDEAHHSRVNSEVMHLIMDAFEIPLSAVAERPRCLVALRDIIEALPPELRANARVAFGIASETLVTGFLSDLPRDLEVASAVREVVADHALDEWKHSAYFTLVLREIWQFWSRDVRETMGQLFPVFLRLFVDPDIEAQRAALLWIGVDPSDAVSILIDSYSREQVDQTAQAASRATIRHLQRVGAFNQPSCVSAFRRERLLS